MRFEVTKPNKNYKNSFRDEFDDRIYKYMLELVKFIDNLPRDTVCRVVGGQLLRSGTSAGANYFEAKSSSSKREYINYFQISLKSANESKIWLRLLKDSGKCKSDKLDWLLDETNQIGKVLASSILTMKGKRNLN